MGCTSVFHLFAMQATIYRFIVVARSFRYRLPPIGMVQVADARTLRTMRTFIAVVCALFMKPEEMPQRKYDQY